jgi:hypothetical protein
MSKISELPATVPAPPNLPESRSTMPAPPNHAAAYRAAFPTPPKLVLDDEDWEEKPVERDRFKTMIPPSVR